METNYLQTLASELGISIWLLVVIFAWSLVWKLLALWKSARKGQPIWFIVLAFINTIGILEILYIYIFSDMKKKSKVEQTVKKKTKKRK